MKRVYRNCRESVEDHERAAFDRLTWGLMVFAMALFAVAMVFGR